MLPQHGVAQLDGLILFLQRVLVSMRNLSSHIDTTNRNFPYLQDVA
jgi:hypothetical protein